MVPQRIFSLNLCQAKSPVISFWVGGWVSGRAGRWVVLRKNFWYEFKKSQIWCYPILGGWVVPRKMFSPNYCQAKSGVISCLVSGPKKKNSVRIYVKLNLLVISFWVGGWSQEKISGLNLQIAKSEFMSRKFGSLVFFWGGGGSVSGHKEGSKQARQQMYWRYSNQISCSARWGCVTKN